MDIFLKIIFILASYLFGAIPFGYIIVKLCKRVDIREYGSKNTGATNVGRVLGKKMALLVFLLDAFKGFIFTFLFRFHIIPEKYMILSPALYGVVALIGHSFPIYLKFKGGKGVATGAGFICGYCPWLLPILLIVFFVTVGISKMISLGSLMATLVALITSLVLFLIKRDPILNLETDIYFFIFTILACAIIFLRHSTNINKIIKKNESKVKW